MTTRHLICLPAVHPYPFPAEDTARYYVVVRGLNPGIYSSRRVLARIASTDTLTRCQRARLTPALNQRRLLGPCRRVDRGLARVVLPLRSPASPYPEPDGGPYHRGNHR